MVSNVISVGSESSLIYFYGIGTFTAEQNIFYNIGRFSMKQKVIPYVAPIKQKFDYTPEDVVES